VGQYFYKHPAGKSNSSFLQSLLQNATAEELLKLVYVCQIARKKNKVYHFLQSTVHKHQRKRGKNLTSQIKSSFNGILGYKPLHIA